MTFPRPPDFTNQKPPFLYRDADQAKLDEAKLQAGSFASSAEKIKAKVCCA